MLLFCTRIAAVYIAFAFFTYIPDYGWWPSLVGTALMLWICRHWLGDDWRKRLGLSGVSDEWPRSAFLFFVLLVTFALYGKYILEEKGLRYDSNYEIGVHLSLRLKCHFPDYRCSPCSLLQSSGIR
ncbi:MAG: hypothetical protein RL189_1083 [Pseudomonadota bacterium]|jgi:hypothetical protein